MDDAVGVFGLRGRLHDGWRRRLSARAVGWSNATNQAPRRTSARGRPAE